MCGEICMYEEKMVTLKVINEVGPQYSCYLGTVHDQIIFLHTI